MMMKPRQEYGNPRGFSLIELLVVIAILALLGGLLFSIANGIFGKGDRSRAESELQAISVALESYRLRFGDYPNVNTPKQLFAALDGKLGPDGFLLAKPFPPILEAGGFSMSDSDSPELMDPWEEPYRYTYVEPDSSAKQSCYRIFSGGPDKKYTVKGDTDDPIDSDNLRYDD